MECKELMIGDWVNTNGTNVKIISIGLFTQVEIMDSSNDVYSVFARDLAPIPLTAEILEKNFPTTEDGVTWNKTADDDLFNIRVEYDKYIEGIFRNVQELQHALRLCNIDKEIEL